MEHSASSLLRDIGLGIVFASAASHGARLLGAGAKQVVIPSSLTASRVLDLIREQA